ncbi:L,D-transpeptidase [Candidatus Margulisiibacteriota bacterium]
MKVKIWGLLLIIILVKVLVVSGSALDIPIPDFLDRYNAYPKELFIEVNIPERALYLYQIYSEKQFLLKKYPCTVGTMEYKTPEGHFAASAFRWNPGWTPPESKWAEDLEAIEPGEKSPLGRAAITVDWEKAVLIHGTRNKRDLGRPASHGCIRLSNKNITELLSYLQDNVPNTLGRARLNAYRVSANHSFWGSFRHPVSVKLIYKRMAKVGDQVFCYPDIYANNKYEPPSLDYKSALINEAVEDLDYVYYQSKDPQLGQEHISKAPYPYRGRGKKQGRKYYAQLKERLVTWYVKR